MSEGMLGLLPLRDVRGPVDDLFEKLASADGAKWLEGLNVLLRTSPAIQSSSPVTPGTTVRTILALLYEGEEIVIGETDGKDTMAGAKSIFTGHLDPDFKGWKTDKPSGPTKPQPVSVYEMALDANFAEMFGSLGKKLDDLCLTQAQIIKFCVEHRARLRQQGYATFFLFKCDTGKGVEYFVAYVRVFDVGVLVAYVYRFGDAYVWSAGYRHRVVLPQLAGSR